MKKDEEMISTSGIMYKIKSFFKNLFTKKSKDIQDEEVEVVEEKSEVETEEKTAFEESIVVKIDEEKERILELQKRFREGKLSPEDVSEEDIDKLAALYDEQIANLKEQIKKDEDIIEKCNKEIEEHKNRKAKKSNA